MNEPTPMLNAEGLKELTGYSYRHLRQLEEQGHIPKNSNGQWPAKETLQCLFRYSRQCGHMPDDLHAVRLRDALAAAELKEMKLAKLKGELVQVAAVMRAWLWAAEAIKARLMSCDRLTERDRADLMKSLSEIRASEYQDDTNQPPTPNPKENHDPTTIQPRQTISTDNDAHAERTPQPAPTAIVSAEPKEGCGTLAPDAGPVQPTQAE